MPWFQALRWSLGIRKIKNKTKKNSSMFPSRAATHVVLCSPWALGWSETPDAGRWGGWASSVAKGHPVTLPCHLISFSLALSSRLEFCIIYIFWIKPWRPPWKVKRVKGTHQINRLCSYRGCQAARWCVRGRSERTSSFKRDVRSSAAAQRQDGRDTKRMKNLVFFYFCFFFNFSSLGLHSSQELPVMYAFEKVWVLH